MSKVLVLGGSSGIGRAVVEHLQWHPGVDQVEAYGLEDWDIRDYGPLEKAVRRTQPTHVVFSVGINRLDWIDQATVGDFRDVMETNVWSFIKLIGALRDEVNHPVSVVAVTSDAAWRVMRTSAIYCASKAALEMAVKVASRELAPKGWRVNGVAPGKVANTGMTEYVDQRVLDLRGWTPEYAEAYERASSALGRKVEATEVADVIVNVLFGSPALTGEIIAVNGGR